MNFKKILTVFMMISLLVFGLSSCSNAEKGKESSEPKKEEKVSEKSLIVYSGAGLKKPMEEIAKEFEKDNNVKIQYIFAGSAQLLSQLEASGKGDVFIVGSKPTYDAAKEKKLVGESKEVAYHTPTIIVKKGNPKKIKTLEDLQKDGIKVILGDEKANAVGKTTQKIIQKNKLTGIEKNVAAKTATVSEMVVQIVDGTADAAIATKDSVFGNDKIEIIEIDPTKNVDQILPIGAAEASKEKELANKFVDYVSSDKGKAVFEKYGFKPVK